MTAPMLMTDCPTPETLAEFVDGTLDDLNRRKVTAHIADCGNCREYVNMASDFQATENVKRWPIGRVAAAAVPALAAAAMIAIFVLRPDFIYGPDMEDVRSAAQSLKFRPSEGQFSDDFAYKKWKSPDRGEGKERDAVSELWSIGEAKDPRVAGIALLHNSVDRPTYETAIGKLRDAYANASSRERDAIAIDLAAALLGPWANEADHREALKLSEGVFERTGNHKAAWNRAVALEALGQDEQALHAFAAYRELDRNSEWTQEALRREKDIRELMSYTAPPPKR